MPRLVSKSLYSVFFSGMPAATPWEPRPLAPLEAQWDFGDELRKGRSLLEGTEDGKTPVAVWNFMFRPILEAMTLCLEEANRIDLVDLLPRYVLFRVGLGMLQPRRIDDVWDKESMHYNAYMAELFPSRRQFYVLQRLADPDADALIELCTMHWQGGWELGDVVCGDETVVPHKGLFVIRQFIPRKPHSTGVKLYALCNAQSHYIWHVYLYRGAAPRVGPESRSRFAGHYNAFEIVQLWNDVTPPGKVLVADSFFGSHDAAAMLSAQERPFLMLTSTSALVQDGNVGLDPGDVNTVVHKEHRYALSVYKNPKVGRKPAKVVPLLTNCLTGGSLPHRSGRYHLPGIIANYRRFAPGVDTFNQMCLQHREEHRFQSWWKALGGMVLRIAATNAFTSCQALRLSPGGETMFDWQWRLMRYMFPARQIEVVDKHVPIVVGKRGFCVHCGMGTTRYKCKACGCYLHVECFADHHE